MFESEKEAILWLTTLERAANGDTSAQEQIRVENTMRRDEGLKDVENELRSIVAWARHAPETSQEIYLNEIAMVMPKGMSVEDFIQMEFLSAYQDLARKAALRCIHNGHQLLSTTLMREYRDLLKKEKECSELQ